MSARPPKRVFRLISRGLNDESGSVAVWVALTLTVLVGFIAMTVDMGAFYAMRGRLQAAADSAALAALDELSNDLMVRSRAHEYIEKHFAVAEHGAVLRDADVLSGNWDSRSKTFTTNGTPLNAVRVTARKSDANGNAQRTYFARVMGIPDVNISATSLAVLSPPSCVIALDPAAAEALMLDSNARIDASGCQVTVNSGHGRALSTDSNAAITADVVCVRGGYDQQGSSTIDPSPETNCLTGADPLARLAAPAVGGCDENGLKLDDYVGSLSPGVFCGGLEIVNNSDVQLDPGIYIIKGGPLMIDGNTKLRGDGVAFYLTEGASIQATSNTVIALTAPTGGSLAGVVFFQDRSYETTHLFDSNSFGTIEGTVYLPTGVLRSDSNTRMAGASNYSLFIAKRLEFDSNAGLDIKTDYGASSVPLPRGVGASRKRLML